MYIANGKILHKRIFIHGYSRHEFQDSIDYILCLAPKESSIIRWICKLQLDLTNYMNLQITPVIRSSQRFCIVEIYPTSRIVEEASDLNQVMEDETKWIKEASWKSYILTTNDWRIFAIKSSGTLTSRYTNNQSRRNHVQGPKEMKRPYQSKEFKDIIFQRREV